MVLFFSALRATSKMRLFTSFTIFIYFSLYENFSSCTHFTSLIKHHEKIKCVNINNASALQEAGLNPSCKSIQHSLMIDCGNGREFTLSTSTLPK